MKRLTDYLEHALSFERMAAQETKPEVRAQFQKQAIAYRKLAAERAARFGLSAPACEASYDGPSVIPARD